MMESSDHADLWSSTFVFVPRESVALQRTSTGELVHAAFFDLLRSVDRDAAMALHDTAGRKPFTLSPLLVADSNGGQARKPHAVGARLEAGSTYCFRATALNRDMRLRLLAME